MNRPQSKLLILLILTLVLFWGTNIELTYEHERAHNMIDKYHGCGETVYHIDYLRCSGFAYCNDENYTPSEQANKLHSINEIVTYNLRSILILITGLFMIYIVIK